MPALDGMIEEQHDRFQFPRVKAWKYSNFHSAPLEERDNHAFPAWQFDAVTEDYGELVVNFYLLNGAVSPSPRLHAIYERYTKAALDNVDLQSYQIAEAPIVHAHFPSKDGDRRNLTVFRQANGRMLSMLFSVEEKKLQKALPVLLELAAQVEINLPTWPPLPAGYDYEKESGLKLAFGPNVSKKRRKQIQKFVREVVKDFEKQYAKPYLNPSAPSVLFVSDDKARNAQLVGATQGYSVDFSINLRRVVTVSFDPKNTAYAALCREVLYRYLSATVYPVGPCMWVHWSIRYLAGLEGQCGKGLPSVPKEPYGWMTKVTKRLEQVAVEGASSDLAAAGSWMSYFRLAPSKDRKAFEDLLGELTTSMDPRSEHAAFVETYKGVEMQQTARKLLNKKLKPASKR